MSSTHTHVGTAKFRIVFITVTRRLLFYSESIADTKKYLSAVLKVMAVLNKMVDKQKMQCT